MPLVHQDTGKENRYGKNCFAILSVHWGDLIEQTKKKICYIHFKKITEGNARKVAFIYLL